jgi:hypothetical protein
MVWLRILQQWCTYGAYDKNIGYIKALSQVLTLYKLPSNGGLNFVNQQGVNT